MAGGRRKSYNTGGNIFPKSARPKLREKQAEDSVETDDKVDNAIDLNFILIQLYRHLSRIMVS